MVVCIGLLSVHCSHGLKSRTRVLIQAVINIFYPLIQKSLHGLLSQFIVHKVWIGSVIVEVAICV